MTIPRTDIATPIAGTGDAAQAIVPSAGTDSTAARRARRERRIVSTGIALLGAFLFVTCVNVELASAQILSRMLVQYRQHLNTDSITAPSTPTGFTTTADS